MTPVRKILFPRISIIYWMTEELPQSLPYSIIFPSFTYISKAKGPAFLLLLVVTFFFGCSSLSLPPSHRYRWRRSLSGGLKTVRAGFLGEYEDLCKDSQGYSLRSRSETRWLGTGAFVDLLILKDYFPDSRFVICDWCFICIALRIYCELCFPYLFIIFYLAGKH